MGSPGAAAAALSRLFTRSVGTEDLGPDLSPPFEPVAELPYIFREAERAHRAGQLDDEGMIAEFSAEFPGLAGAAIFRDSEDSGRTVSRIADMPWPE